MATVSGQPANVQAYLDKHRISTLFEDLTAFLVKDLPTTPIDYLITKLQDKKKKSSSTTRPVSSSNVTKKPTSATTRTGISTAKPRTGVSSTTTTTTAKTTRSTTAPKTTTSAVTKPATTRPVSKTADTKRPIGAGSKPVTKSAIPSKSSTTSVKPSSSTSSVASSRSGIASSSRLPKSPGSKVGVPKTGGVTPKKSGIASKTTVASKAKPTESKVTVKKPDPVPTPVKRESDEEKPEPDQEKPEPVPEEQTTVKPEPVKEEVPPTTESKTPSESVEVTEEDVPTSVSEETNTDDTQESNAEPNDEGTETDEEEEDSLHDSGTTLDVEELMRVKRSKKLCKHGEKAHLKDLLQTAEPEVGVVIHDSDEEQESEDEGLDVVENHEILEEEGVVVNEHAKRMSMKLPSTGPLVDLKVTICARCAKVIKANEEGSVVISSSRLSALEDGIDDSASQVVGSQVPFPQWDSSSVSDASQLSLKEKWALMGQTTPSTTSDEWKGLTPKPHPQQSPSDEEESELKLPEPVDYHKPSEDDSTTVVKDDPTESED